MLPLSCILPEPLILCPSTRGGTCQSWAPTSPPLCPPGVHYDSLPSLGAQPLPEQHKRMPDQDAGMRPRWVRAAGHRAGPPGDGETDAAPVLQPA